MAALLDFTVKRTIILNVQTDGEPRKAYSAAYGDLCSIVMPHGLWEAEKDHVRCTASQQRIRAAHLVPTSVSENAFNRLAIHYLVDCKSVAMNLLPCAINFMSLD